VGKGVAHDASVSQDGSDRPNATSGPSVFVLAGPNGAGKTTVAPAIIRDTLGIVEFVNADMIAAGLSGFAPDRSAFAAGRIMMERLRALAADRATFAFETTLATRSFAPWLVSLSDSGYRVLLTYLWLPSAEMAVARVAQRVREGGHDVPEAVVRRRYERGLSNFVGLYRNIVDEWTLYDSSEVPGLIARQARGQPVSVAVQSTWQRVMEACNDAER